jgi:3',5'-cyclic AMP phosphodiesterase CpdA
MTQNKREIIELEIVSLKKTIDKINIDHMIITGMIHDLMNDRGGMTKETIKLTKMIRDRDDKGDDKVD